ncbi:uncharacterized protein LOC134250409 isoform X1 [Saccostrea cucullata]|uniref:uncharacterized protein LOC134250409 isoform X1 n=2 Tax=Saccostrea cuccullata TaxID=36930 RepID=UPI002ED0A41C
MGSGGSKSPPVKETLTSNKENTESSSPSPAPLDTNVNVNSGGQSTNQSEAESGSANQNQDKIKPQSSEKSVLPEKAAESEGNKEQTENTEGTMPTTKPKEGASPAESEERLIPEVHKEQQLFDDALSSACQLVKSQSLMKLVTLNVTSLCLQRALPQGFSLYELLKKMTNLQDLDLSHNDMGPQGFRSLCLAMCTNTSILCLNLSDNKTDTDSAECLGLMLSHNGSMSYLNISNNYFGKDYFSRCVGPALKTNKSLMNFRAENIGATDVKDFLAGLKENTSLTELDFSNNWVTDKTALGAGLGEVLKRENCGLVSLALAGCEINKTGAAHLLEGVKENTSLSELNVNRLEFESLSHLLHFVAASANNPNLQVLSIDGAKFKDTTVDTKDIVVPAREAPPSLQILSLSDSHLTDEFFEALQTLYQGRQIPLVEIDVSSNDGLTGKCVHFLAELTKGDESPSTIQKLRLGLCSGVKSLPEELISSDLPCLHYLNVRKSKIPDLYHLSKLFTEKNLTTLILDGQKIANTDTLEKLLAGSSKSHLTTLSLSSCALSANDIKPLSNVIKEGLKLQMLKLAGNRLEDQGVLVLVEAVAANKTHPLAVLDVSDNTFGDEGAKQIASLFTNKKHKTQLHSLNLSHNNVGKTGLLAVVSVIGGKSPLRTLYLQNQTTAPQLTIPDMVEVYTKLAQNLGFKIKKTGDQIEPGSCDLPKLPEGLVVRLTELGGNTGDIGQMLDSVRIKTDYILEKPPLLPYSDILTICAVLKGSGSEIPVWSSEHWRMITGLNRPTADAPSWLELPDSRDRCLYLSNLPANSTTQKLEAILEMDADCNLDEVCLMKDPVTRSVNGVGWALMTDEESLQKAVDFYNSGEAKVFGQSFIISRVKVKVDDDEHSVAAQKAKEDLELRMKLRQKEEQDLRRLIQRTTEESWKRHAYRLAHPAYADGRIW